MTNIFSHEACAFLTFVFCLVSDALMFWTKFYLRQLWLQTKSRPRNKSNKKSENDRGIHIVGMYE